MDNQTGPVKPAEKKQKEVTPYTDALNKLTPPKGGDNGPHDKSHAKYNRLKQLLEDLIELFEK